MKKHLFVSIILLSFVLVGSVFADDATTDKKSPDKEVDYEDLPHDTKYILNKEKDKYEACTYYFSKENWKKYFNSDNFFDTSKAPTIPYVKKKVEVVDCPEQDFIRKNLHSEEAVKKLKDLVEYNPEEIESAIYLPKLTPELAQVLAESELFLTFLVLQDLSPEVAKILAKSEWDLEFDSLRVLKPEIATELAKCAADLSFNKLKSISIETAKALGQHTGNLEFDDLRELSPECAKALESHEGSIRLFGLTKFNQATAKMLVDVNNKESFAFIALNFVNEISPEVASEFARFKGLIMIEGEFNLTYDVAFNLSKFKGKYISATVKTLTSKVASGFSKFESLLILLNLESLTVETARELAKMPGSLMIPEELLKKDEIIDEFIKARTKIDLSFVEVLTPKMIKLLAFSNEEYLLLPQLKTVSEEAAKTLAQHKGQLYLTSVEKLDENVAKILQKHEGSVFLPNLTEINPETARLLLKIDKVDSVSFMFGFMGGTIDFESEFDRQLSLLTNQTPFISLDKISAITPEVAEILGQYPNILSVSLKNLTADIAAKLVIKPKMLILNKLTTLDIDVAKELVKGNAVLHFPRLSDLTPELARELAKCKTALILPGVRTLTVEVARELAKTKVLSLDWLSELTPEVAEEFVKNSNTVSFDSICINKISVDLAKVLAKHKGILSIKGVDEISDEVAKILAKSEGVILAQDEILVKIFDFKN